MASKQKRGKGTYLLVVEAGLDAKGERKRRTKTVKAKNNTEANLLLAAFQIEVESGEHIKPNKMKFEDFVGKWKERYAEKDLAPLTFKTYNHHLKNHIIPTIGHMRLDEIKPFRIVEFLDDLSKPGARKDGRGDTLASGTVAYIYRVMKNIFTKAKEWEFIAKNPMEAIKKPKVTTAKMKFYDQEEAQLAIEALYKEPPMWRYFALGALVGGFRRGELLALKWTNVDHMKNTITIEKSISLTEKGKAIEKKPKSDDSERIVAMPAWYMEELKEYHKVWMRERTEVIDQWEDREGQYIFHAGLGKPLYHTQPSKWWREFCKRHDLKYIRFHDLRHSAATILIQNDTPLKAIQERLGHSTYQTTADLYAHVADSVSRSAADKLEVLRPNFKKPSTERQQA